MGDESNLLGAFHYRMDMPILDHSFIHVDYAYKVGPLNVLFVYIYTCTYLIIWST